MRSDSWKTAVLAALLSAGASPALASDATSGPAAATAERPGRWNGNDLERAPVGAGRVREQVAEREDRVGAPRPPPAPTGPELRRAKREAERNAERLNEIWSAP